MAEEQAMDWVSEVPELTGIQIMTMVSQAYSLHAARLPQSNNGN